MLGRKDQKYIGVNMDEGLVYVGKIIKLESIEGADFIESATVICGKGGKWRGIVKKGTFEVDGLCVVYLPDSVIPPSDDFKFMEKHRWRVRMMKLKGAPSEVLITAPPRWEMEVGVDVTQVLGVKKYYKPISPHLQGVALGAFPSFIPKTDEPNYQSHGDLVEKLVGLPYYITVKMDGSSTTAYKYKGHFGVCSRNLELVESGENGYWEIANRYNLRENLPEGIALQWETCGPKIQSNPSGFKELCGFAFSAYNIEKKKYLNLAQLHHLCQQLKFPMVEVIEAKLNFTKQGVELLGEGKYENGHEREGVVVRSQFNIDDKLISFKVINLNYEK